MKVLMVHNAYQIRGGEEVSFRAEADLLRHFEHEVVTYERDNREIGQMGMLERVSVANQTIWSARSYREIQRLIKTEGPDLVHFQNTFPLVSPSAYYAVKDLGLPVVQSIRNFRLLCPAATFLRDGKICEDCRAGCCLIQQ